MTDSALVNSMAALRLFNSYLIIQIQTTKVETPVQYSTIDVAINATLVKQLF